MKIETYIDSLVSYAMNNGLAEPVDHMVLTNRLLDLLRKDDYEPSDELLIEDLEEILAGILDYAVEKGICDDGITARDIFDTRIMGAVTPMPREVIAKFYQLYQQDSRPRRPYLDLQESVLPSHIACVLVPFPDRSGQCQWNPVPVE